MFELINEKIVSPVLTLSKGIIGDAAYYFAFAAVFMFRFYYTSMFPTILAKPLFLALPYYAGLLLLVAFSCLNIIDALLNSRKEVILLIFILLAAVLNAVTLKQFDYFLPFFLLILASRGRNIRPVFILYIVIGSVFLLTAYYASMNGYIPYLVYDRGNAGMLSHAFGMNYRTTLAGYVMCIIMCYAIVRAERIHLWEYLMLWFDNWLVWRYTQSRTACFCMAVFLVVHGVVIVFYRIRGEWIKIPKWSALVHILCAAGSFVAVGLWAKLGDSNISIPEGGDSLVSRLSLSVEAFTTYPINLFGNVVRERSAGGLVDTSEPYFYLDILYVRVLFIGGIALFILYLALMTIASLKAAKMQQVILALALFVIGVDSIVESHFLTLSFNVLILYSLGFLGSGEKNLSSHKDVE